MLVCRSLIGIGAWMPIFKPVALVSRGGRVVSASIAAVGPLVNGCQLMRRDFKTKEVQYNAGGIARRWPNGRERGLVLKPRTTGLPKSLALVDQETAQHG